MKRDYSISVAMATFNGEKYIKEQIDSILVQLNNNDELIISDDGSTDNTLKIIKGIKDKRVKLISGPKKGVKQNFANAISNCKGKYIFLSDQDDIWVNRKVEVLLNAFEKDDCDCIVHDCEVFNSENNIIIYPSFFHYRKSGSGYFKNIIKNTYIGCCMAFNSRVKRFVLPIPNDIAMHDQWIGLICEKKGKTIFIKDNLLRYRRHDGNVTGLTHSSIINMIKNRLKLIKNLKNR